MQNNSIQRFFGGSPGRVLLQLVFLSFVVGILLSALNLHPLDLIDGAIDFVRRLWNMGFDALGRMGHYLLLGAVVVVPVWVIMRLFNMGRR